MSSKVYTKAFKKSSFMVCRSFATNGKKQSMASNNWSESIEHDQQLKSIGVGSLFAINGLNPMERTYRLQLTPLIHWSGTVNQFQRHQTVDPLP